MSVNLSAPINSLGYGCVGTNLALALERAGAQPALFPIGGVDAEERHAAPLRAMLGRAAFFSPSAPSLRVYHQFDLAQSIGFGRRWAFPIFELDRFKPVERHHLMTQELVFVTSEWAAEIARNHSGLSPDKVVVAPLGVDRFVFNPNRKDLHCDIRQKMGGDTVFFCCGKWEYRKGHDVLLEAFNDAFEPDSRVRLVMNCYNPCRSMSMHAQEHIDRYNREWTRSYRNSKMGGRITVIDRRLPSQQDVADWMAAADCGVFPSRAEGWGLESAEMLAMGRHVILTNYSAHTQYANSDNALLIDIDGTEYADDGHWFDSSSAHWGGEQPGSWARMGPDQVDQMVSHMRRIHDMKQGGDDMFNSAGVESMVDFTWDNTARVVLEEVSREYAH